MTMPRLLKRLRISSVDLCRRGANPLARIALSKSDGAGELRARIAELVSADMTRDELLSALKDLLNGENGEAAPDEAQPDQAAPAQEGASPEVQRESDEVRALRRALAHERATAVAKRYEGVCADAQALASRLERLSALDGEAYDGYVALLGELAEARRIEPFMKEYGCARSPSSALDMRVAEILRLEPGLTRAQAIVRAYQSDPDIPEVL